MENIIEKVKEKLIKNIVNLDLQSENLTEFSLEIQELIEKFFTINFLNLDNNNLSSLRYFPNLENLKYVNLSNNKLPDSELNVVSSFLKLEVILLNYNNIEKVQSFKCLINLKKLKGISLLDNPICESDNYRKDIFGLLTQIEFLDFINKDNEIVNFKFNPFHFNLDY